jgi:glutamate 5-kinase
VKGDVISLRNIAGVEIARGLTNYDSREAARIAGKQSGCIAETLGHCPYTEAIHRDNMFVL